MMHQKNKTDDVNLYDTVVSYSHNCAGTLDDVSIVDTASFVL